MSTRKLNDCELEGKLKAFRKFIKSKEILSDNFGNCALYLVVFKPSTDQFN